MSKKSSKALVAVLVLALAGSIGIGLISNGFQNWNLEDWKNHFIPTPSTSDPTDTSSDISSDSSSEPIEELSYSITFSPATTTNIALDEANFKGISSEDAQIMNYGTIEKVYREAPDAIKFGTTTAKGVLSFTLPENLQVLSVVVEAKTYTNDATIMLANGTEQPLTNDFVEYEFDFEVLETATIEFTSKNTSNDRFYIRSISIIHSDTAIPEPEAPVYERVEAEIYEIQLPLYVNGNFAYGSLYINDLTLEGFMISGFSVSIDDEYGLSSFGDGSVIHLELATDDSAQTEFCLPLLIMPGDYGRYIISDVQVPNEPVSFTLVPVYEYILVE